jgi:L-threonylcarbamoyladenylate synthase
MTAPLTARIYSGTPRNLARLAAFLQSGGIVAVPTETVYGLAANALDAAACRKIFKAKGRPSNDPLIVHIHSLKQLDAIAESNDAARQLARRFWPGPLTMVLPKRAIIPSVVSSGLPSVAVRMPRHPIFRRLLKLTDRPLAAPSANPFGYVSPTSAAHVKSSLGTKIAHILDGGDCTIGVESTIIDLRDPKSPVLLRPGAVTREQIEAVLGVPVSAAGKRAAARPQVAPGLLAKHYSPRTPAILHSRITAADVAKAPRDDAWIFVRRPSGLRGKAIFWLDEKGRLSGVARNLFRTLRQVDAAGFKLIHLERAPGGGLADAINDRLERAAGRWK